MTMLKNRLLAANVVGMFVLAYALLSQPGLAAPSASVPGVALTTQFIYEGRLGTFSGAYDFQFRLFDAASGGVLVGSPSIMLVNNAVVDQGEYQVVLNFGATAFTGDARYLEVGYRAGANTGDYTIQPARRPILPTAYALSLRPGAIVNGSINTPTIRSANNGNGIGLWSSAINNPGVLGTSVNSNGVSGSTDATTANAAGVYGQGTRGVGVRGVSTTNPGVLGTSSTSNGVSGSTSATTANGAGVYGRGTTGVGVRGVSTDNPGVIGTSTNSNGVSGIGNAQAAAGVYGESSAGVGISGKSTFGYAMRAQGHTAQTLQSGGWVKAMALIGADGSVEQCFNSQLQGIVATFSPCGITVTKGSVVDGMYNVDFGFPIQARFLSITPLKNGDSIAANINFYVNSTTVQIGTKWSFREGGGNAHANAPFFIIVY